MEQPFGLCRTNTTRRVWRTPAPRRFCWERRQSDRIHEKPDLLVRVQNHPCLHACEVLQQPNRILRDILSSPVYRANLWSQFPV